MASQAPSYKLILEMLNQKKDALEPEIDPKTNPQYSYPFADQILGTTGNETVNLLESMARENLLKKEFVDRFVSCPYCGSINLRFVTKCPACGAKETAKRSILQHVECGYIGPEEEFTKKPGPPVCPRCGKQVAIRSRKEAASQEVQPDVTVYSAYYKCLQCGEINAELKENFQCLVDGKILEKKELEETPLYRYTLTEYAVARVQVGLMPLLTLAKRFEGTPLKVETPAKLVGKSGIEHNIDMIVYDAIAQDKRIIIDVATSEKEVTVEPLISLYTKSLDVQARAAILLAIPKLSEEARKFSQFYNIKIYEGSAEKIDSQEIVKILAT